MSLKKIRHLFFIIGFSFFALQCLGQAAEQKEIDSLLNQLSGTKEDSIKAKLYLRLMWAHSYYKAEEGLKYEQPALELAQKLKRKEMAAKYNTIAGRLYWRIGKHDDALKRHYDALLYFTEAKDQGLAAECLVFLGQDFADGGRYPQALLFFKRALKIYETIGDKDQIANVSTLLSWVHANMGNYAEAAKLDYSILKLYEELGDTNLIALAISNIAQDNFYLGNYPEALIYYDRAIKTLLGSSQMENVPGCYNDIGNIYLITGNYPESTKNYSLALQMAEKITSRFAMAVAYRGLGDVCKAQGKLGDALKNYLMGVGILKSINNKQELSSLYSKMGNCYVRMKNYKEAKECFDQALVLSKELNSNVSFSEYYQGRELLDSATGRWEDAYKNHKQFISLRDSTFNKDNLKKMLSSQMKYENDKKEAEARAEQEKKDIRQRTIRNSISGVLAGTILFLVVVYRQRNKISKARKRSDELLLNILPEEVAEELKEKGSAEAKQFDEVTVMFTDFKNFTQISEKLTPSELVAEIHTCFKAFDEIIAKHNVEKIKTIGDAYMCAGGLPVANTTHAIDVVNAAMEIQKFMQQHLQHRKNEGKEPFEIRIGIHTGPVVAGIVGVKKFAYDIWGDTVNIASRMESSGEAGRINISGNTYELVKDKFICKHRGKIQAKNKGEIDMYFVEGISFA